MSSARAHQIASLAPRMGVVLFLLFVAMSGCRRGASPASAGLFEPEQAAPDMLRAAQAYPLEPASETFSVMSEGGAAGVVTITVEEDGDGRWRVLHRNDGEETPFREDVLARTESGVVMLESLSRERDALTVYEPPLILMPDRLRAEEPFEHQVAMTVHPPDDRTAVKRRGEATQRLELLGVQRVATGRGRVEATHVRSLFTAKLAPAVVENVTESWYADESDIGLVAQRYDEKLFIFGALSSTRGYLWILE